MNFKAEKIGLSKVTLQICEGVTVATIDIMDLAYSIESAAYRLIDGAPPETALRANADGTVDALGAGELQVSNHPAAAALLQAVFALRAAADGRCLPFDVKWDTLGPVESNTPQAASKNPS